MFFFFFLYEYKVYFSLKIRSVIVSHGNMSFI